MGQFTGSVLVEVRQENSSSGIGKINVMFVELIKYFQIYGLLNGHVWGLIGGEST
ncbi:hypothetical protein DSCA_00360 [Desulfosarcina alkanivorans]|uniref:Uncharacterized protein n=1 Tax=Desulfosarcina alkanivorans TaxID=571177 RepID=A0A5K7YB34_9BACT|nr:hypothetical protein DSCA_00360 [Desulfosarcina alkanivorans]